mmetsp:Transcript_5070/g.12745  ORF Transcript_5070/g.12745 Transcript_5070/m.12745 type:complete len:366 (-) Transcript_5070:1538-2635(-)
MPLGRAASPSMPSPATGLSYNSPVGSSASSPIACAARPSSLLRCSVSREATQSRNPYRSPRRTSSHAALLGSSSSGGSTAIFSSSRVARDTAPPPSSEPRSVRRSVRTACRRAKRASSHARESSESEKHTARRAAALPARSYATRAHASQRSAERVDDAQALRCARAAATGSSRLPASSSTFGAAGNALSSVARSVLSTAHAASIQPRQPTAALRALRATAGLDAEFTSGACHFITRGSRASGPAPATPSAKQRLAATRGASGRSAIDRPSSLTENLRASSSSSSRSDVVALPLARPSEGTSARSDASTRSAPRMRASCGGVTHGNRLTEPTPIALSVSTAGERSSDSVSGRFASGKSRWNTALE